MIESAHVSALVDDFSAEENPAVGGRAGLGALGGITIGSFAAAAYLTLADKWDKPTSPRVAQLYEMALFGLAAPTGAALGALPGRRRGAAVGALIGVAVAELPLLAFPDLLRRGDTAAEAFTFRPQRRLLGWAWSIGVPVLGAILGANFANEHRGP